MTATRPLLPLLLLLLLAAAAAPAETARVRLLNLLPLPAGHLPQVVVEGQPAAVAEPYAFPPYRALPAGPLNFKALLDGRLLDDRTADFKPGQAYTVALVPWRDGAVWLRLLDSGLAGVRVAHLAAAADGYTATAGGEPTRTFVFGELSPLLTPTAGVPLTLTPRGGAPRPVPLPAGWHGLILLAPPRTAAGGIEVLLAPDGGTEAGHAP